MEEEDFGVCCQRYHSPYITINAAIGSTEKDIQLATNRLDKVLKKAEK
jgi:hypothetical protein